MGKKRFCGSSTGFPSAPKQPQSSRHAVSKIRYHLCISPCDDFIWFPHVSHLRKLKLWRCVSATVLYPIVSRQNQSCTLRAQVFAKTCSQSLAHGRRLAAQSPMGYRFCVLDKASPNVFWMAMMAMVMQYVIQCVILSPFVTSWLKKKNVLSWYHVISCHIMSCHVTPHHVTSRYLLFRSVLFLFVYVYSVHMCISTYEYKENMHTAWKKTQPQSGTYYMYIYIYGRMITYMSSMAKITVLTFYWKDWSTILNADHRLSMPQLCCWFSVLLDRFAWTFSVLWKNT